MRPRNPKLRLQNTRDLFALLHERGVANPELLSPAQFYRKHRFGVPDLAAVGLIVVPPIVGFLTLLLVFGRALWRASSRVPCERRVISENAR